MTPTQLKTALSRIDVYFNQLAEGYPQAAEERRRAFHAAVNNGDVAELRKLCTKNMATLSEAAHANPIAKMQHHAFAQIKTENPDALKDVLQIIQAEKKQAFDSGLLSLQRSLTEYLAKLEIEGEKGIKGAKQTIAQEFKGDLEAVIRGDKTTETLASAFTKAQAQHQQSLKEHKGSSPGRLGELLEKAEKLLENRPAQASAPQAKQPEVKQEEEVRTRPRR